MKCGLIRDKFFKVCMKDWLSSHVQYEQISSCLLRDISQLNDTCAKEASIWKLKNAGTPIQSFYLELNFI